MDPQRALPSRTRRGGQPPRPLRIGRSSRNGGGCMASGLNYLVAENGAPAPPKKTNRAEENTAPFQHDTETYTRLRSFFSFGYKPLKEALPRVTR